MSRSCLIVPIVLLFVGCAANNPKIASNSVFVGELVSVKLFPTENIVEHTDGTLTISASCGRAEVTYKLASGALIGTTMKLGEWCENPISKGDVQLVLVDREYNIIEYYATELDDRGLLIAGINYRSNLVGLAKPLREPHFVGFIKDYDGYRIHQETESGLYEVRGEEIFRIKAIYVDDFRSITAL